MVSTHSRPKAAGAFETLTTAGSEVSTHSRPKAAGETVKAALISGRFQHTAARRRLAARAGCSGRRWVSTHSRPKAAVLNYYHDNGGFYVSTHSRPKAADTWLQREDNSLSVSTHSRPKAAGFHINGIIQMILFQHTAARRRLKI